MTATVKPSDIYRGISPPSINSFLIDEGYRIIDFRLVRSGDEVLFFNSGKLKIGTATVENAGYVRFVVAPIAGGVYDFWE